VKKFLVLALTLMISLGVASVSLASTVSLDVLSSGEVKVKSNSGSGTPDLSQVSIGIDVPMDKFKFASNISNGAIEGTYTDFDTTSILLKGGYALINNNQIRLDVTGGFYNRERDIYFVHGSHYLGLGELSVNSLIIGFDSKFIIDKHIWIDFNLALGISPKLTESLSGYRDQESDLDSVSLLNLKFNYLFTKVIGASLGYTCETIEFNNSYKEEFSGLTVGAFYKF
jgi:hypothetical protein